ncbi:MAG: hypothetical protein RL095_3855 [Verrucomicrobiota bacterium]|jgi:pimeloyl-ACP methyl ester carboxylesterase
MPAESRPVHWILLRGLVRESRHWGDFPDRIRQCFPGDLVICPELPGCGRRRSERSSLAIGDYASDLEQQIADLPHPRILVALSLGGMVGLSLAQGWPRRLDGLVLINSSAAWLSPFFRRLSPGAWPVLLSTLWRRDPQNREEGILGLVSNSPEARSAALPLWSEIQGHRPVQTGNALRQLAAAAKFRLPASFSQSELPILVLNSLGDRLVHPSCSVTLSRALHAPLATHPSAGHDLPLDAPAWVLHQLREFRRGLKHD